MLGEEELEGFSSLLHMEALRLVYETWAWSVSIEREVLPAWRGYRWSLAPKLLHVRLSDILVATEASYALLACLIIPASLS